VNLLEHEVRVAALLGRLGRPRDHVHGPLHHCARSVGDDDRTRPQVGDVAVGQEYDLLGVGDDGRGIRGEETLAFAQADDEGRVQARADQPFGLVAMHHYQRVGALEPAEGGADRVRKIAPVGVSTRCATTSVSVSETRTWPPPSIRRAARGSSRRYRYAPR